MLMFVTLGCATITFLMSILHFLLSIGLPLGEYVLGGNNRKIPREKRYINWIFTLIFFFIGLFYISTMNFDHFQLSSILSRIIMIVYTVFLGYAIIGNIFFTHSKKEKMLMIPTSSICFVFSLFTLVLSW